VVTEPTAPGAFGRYLLGPRLAVGGMGEVYVATQLGMGAYAKPLVLKLLLPHLATKPKAVEMFLTEARLASRMNHPNVVHIFDVGVIEGRYFIALELIRGVALSELLAALRQSGTPLASEQLLYIARCLCEGLHHAHEQRGSDGIPLGLIHRDVTPENILVGVEGQVKLTDFGIARAVDQRPDPSIAGKLGYIAPEILEGGPIDRRADVFSAAVTLFTLATLKHPFTAETREQTLKAVLSAALPDLRVLRPDLPLEFVVALEQATAKDPATRLASARALRDALPPPTRAETSDGLGELVQRLCGSQLGHLNENVERTEQLRVRTQAVSSTAGVVAPSRSPSRPSVVAAAIVGLFAVAAGVWAFSRPAAPRPEPVVVVPVAAAIVSAVESAPTDAGDPVAQVAPAVAPVVPTPPVAKARPARRETPPGVAKSPGFIVIDATPWARVSINGADVGETPIAAFPSPPGRVQVTLTNPETGRTVTQRIQVRSGERTFVRSDLR
jgi:serine/threonine protein kinase